MAKIEFVSYDGKYPYLCMGELIIKIDGKTYSFKNAMRSGGCILKNEDWNMWSETGPWYLDLEEHPELEEYKEKITEVINDNVEWGCCGGCI